jgi:hypothetical protein
VSGQLHAPAALPPGKEPRYPLDRRLGGPQSRSGRFGEEKILDPTGTRTPNPLVVQPIASRKWWSLTSTLLCVFMARCLIYETEGQLLPPKRVPQSLTSSEGTNCAVKNFAAFYGTRKFITVFTRAPHWSLSWARWIQSIPFYLSKIYFNIVHPPTSWSS